MQEMMDIGATHNFINEGTATQSGLSAGKHASRVKVINSQARSVAGRVVDVPIQLGKWQGKTDLLVVTLDAFELILGMEFLKTSKAIIVPHLGGLLIMDSKTPCLVEGVITEKKGKDVMLSTHQLAHGLKNGEQPLLLLCWKFEMIWCMLFRRIYVMSYKNFKMSYRQNWLESFFLNGQLITKLNWYRAANPLPELLIGGLR